VASAAGQRATERSGMAVERKRWNGRRDVGVGNGIKEPIQSEQHPVPQQQVIGYVQ